MKKVSAKMISAGFVLIISQIGECSFDINQEISSFEGRPVPRADVVQQQSEENQSSVIERRRDAEIRAHEAAEAAKQIYGEDCNIDFWALEMRLLGRFLAEAENQDLENDPLEIVNGLEQITLSANVENEEPDYAEVYSGNDQSGELRNNHDRTEELSLDNGAAEKEITEEVVIVDDNDSSQEDSDQAPFLQKSLNNSESEYRRYMH